jgi:hypothetical protein
LLLPSAFCLVTLIIACARSTTPSDPPIITLHAPLETRPAFVEVTGLSSSELSSVRDARFAPEEWASLLKVTVDEGAGDALPPVEGRYEVTGAGVTFTPRFAFDRGRAYRVTFNPHRLPRRRDRPAIASVVRLDAVTSSPTTTVTAVYPSSEILAANTLRLYVEFSAPMGRGAGREFVRLLDEHGQEIPGAFLPVEADFWNADHTRYTLFFDPGRVKQGILPNRQMGRPLEAGHQYTLDVSPNWRDGHDQPLAAVYRRSFRAGPAAAAPLSPGAWRIAPPAAGTRDPLAVTFPAPLDHGLLARAIGVEAADGRPLEGDISLEDADRRWMFTPRMPWAAGGYQLVALAILEDPSGNRIGRAFEVDSTETTGRTAPDAYRSAFQVSDRGF